MPEQCLASITKCSTNALVRIVKFVLDLIGFKNALDAFKRHPFFWVTSKYDDPKLLPRLKSSTAGIPACEAANRKTSKTFHFNLCLSTRHGPPAP